MFAALSNLLKKYGFTHQHPSFPRGEDFIDVKELISNLTDEQLIRSANEYWTNIGPNSEQFFKPFHNPVDSARVLKNLGDLLDKASLYPNAKVLDFGCGNGWLAKSLAHMGMHAFGIDIAEKAISLAREYKRDPFQRGTAEYAVFDGYNIPFSDNFFDRIVIFDAFHHVNDPEEMLREFSRVLRPGGRIAMSEPSFDHSAAPHSQKDMRDYDVIENTLDILQIARIAESVGLTPPQFLLQGPEVETRFKFNQSEWRDHDKIHRHFMETINNQKVGKDTFFGFKFHMNKPSGNRKLLFTDKQLDNQKLLKSGFSSPEPFGTWTLGSKSTILLNLRANERNEVCARLCGNIFVPPSRKKCVVKIFINDEFVDQRTFSAEQSFTWTFPIIGKSTKKLLQDIEIKIMQTNVQSPKKLGISEDDRKLSLGLKSIVLIRPYQAK